MIIWKPQRVIMSNLIVTTIAIGLAAALSLSTIYYGGSAYQQSQIKARAGTLIVQAQQIAAAWKQWSNNNGDQLDFGNTKLVAWYTGSLVNNPLVPKYLNQMPRLSSINGPQAVDYWYFVNWASPGISANLPAARPPNALRASFNYTDVSYNLCQQYVKSFLNVTVTPSLATAPTRSPADCIVIDIDASGTANNGDTVDFFYKVF